MPAAFSSALPQPSLRDAAVQREDVRPNPRRAMLIIRPFGVRVVCDAAAMVIGAVSGWTARTLPNTSAVEAHVSRETCSRTRTIRCSSALMPWFRGRVSSAGHGAGERPAVCAEYDGEVWGRVGVRRPRHGLGLVPGHGAIEDGAIGHVGSGGGGVRRRRGAVYCSATAASRVPVGGRFGDQMAVRPGSRRGHDPHSLNDESNPHCQ